MVDAPANVIKGAAAPFNTLSDAAKRAFSNEELPQPTMWDSGEYQVAPGAPDPAQVGESAIQMQQELMGLGEAPAGAIGMNVGPRATGSSLIDLAKARLQRAGGVGLEAIRQGTGWEPGYRSTDTPPNMTGWRREISDAGSQNRSNMVANPLRLRDILHHPDLYREYPDMADMPAALYDQAQYPNASGFWTPHPQGYPQLFRGTSQAGHPWGGIAMARGQSTDEGLGTLLHEGQHAIQNQEHWAQGTNPSRYSQYLPQVNNWATQIMNAHPFIGQNNITHQQLVEHLIQQMYRRTAGEEEAFNTEFRKGMTAPELKATSREATTGLHNPKRPGVLDLGDLEPRLQNDFGLGHFPRSSIFGPGQYP